MKWKVSNKTGDRFYIDLKQIEWLRENDVAKKLEGDDILIAEQIQSEFAWLNQSKPVTHEEEVATAKEIEQWKKFDVYEEVDRRDFPDQEVLDCRWVINEKQKEEGRVVKARLVVIKGFQEASPPIGDSPTASKSVARIFLVLRF